MSAPAPARPAARPFTGPPTRLTKGSRTSPRSERIGRRRDLLPWLPLAVVAAVWVVSLRHVDLAAMDDLGLVSVLPVTYWVALVATIVVFAVLVHRDRVRDRVLTAYVVALVLELHATPTVLYGSLRYSWGWKHIGIVDYIVRHGSVDPQITQLGVYHAWPGFFALNAVLTDLVGVKSALSYAAWGPPFFELLYLGPLLLLFRALSPDRRRRWVAVLVFYLGNWIGQDYFSPQAFAFFLYLVILAVALRLVPAPGTAALPGQNHPLRRAFRRLTAGTPTQRVPVTRGQERVLVTVLVLAMAVIASVHQLTPVITIGALLLLVLARYVRPWWLPLAMAALTAGWIAWQGRTFLAANLPSLAAAFGNVTDNSTTTLVDLASATAQQHVVDWADRLLTAVLWPLAVAGFWRQWVLGRRETVAALLALVPVPMLAVNDYGGEMVFRIFLFALPFLAFLASGVLQTPDVSGRVALAARRTAAATDRRGPTTGRHVAAARARSASGVISQRPAPLRTAVTGVGLVVLFVLAYYGKERMNYFDPNERAASTWLYAHAPRGSLMSSVNSNYPWAFTHYEWYDYDFVQYLPAAQLEQLVTDPKPVVEHFVAAGCTRPLFLVLSASQDLEVRYTAELDARLLEGIRRTVTTDPSFRVVYRNPDVSIYQVDRAYCPLP